MEITLGSLRFRGEALSSSRLPEDEYDYNVMSYRDLSVIGLNSFGLTSDELLRRSWD